MLSTYYSRTHTIPADRQPVSDSQAVMGHACNHQPGSRSTAISRDGMRTLVAWGDGAD